MNQKRGKKKWIIVLAVIIAILYLSPIYLILGTNNIGLFVEDKSHTLEDQFRKTTYSEYRGWKMGFGYGSDKNDHDKNGLSVEQSRFINLGLFSSAAYKMTFDFVVDGDTTCFYFKSKGMVWGLGNPSIRKQLLNAHISKFIADERAKLRSKNTNHN